MTPDTCVKPLCSPTNNAQAIKHTYEYTYLVLSWLIVNPASQDTHFSAPPTLLLWLISTPDWPARISKCGDYIARFAFRTPGWANISRNLFNHTPGWLRHKPIRFFNVPGGWTWGRDYVVRFFGLRCRPHKIQKLCKAIDKANGCCWGRLQSLGCVLVPCACGRDKKLNSCHLKQKPSTGWAHYDCWCWWPFFVRAGVHVYVVILQVMVNRLTSGAPLLPAHRSPGWPYTARLYHAFLYVHNFWDRQCDRQRRNEAKLVISWNVLPPFAWRLVRGFVSGPRKGNALAVSVCKNGSWTGWDAGWSSGEVCSGRQVWFCARLRLRWTRLALLHRQSQNLQIKITCSYVCSILPVARLLACWKGLLLCHMLIIA